MSLGDASLTLLLSSLFINDLQQFNVALQAAGC